MLLVLPPLHPLCNGEMMLIMGVVSHTWTEKMQQNVDDHCLDSISLQKLQLCPSLTMRKNQTNSIRGAFYNVPDQIPKTVKVMGNKKPEDVTVKKSLGHTGKCHVVSCQGGRNELEDWD